MSLSELEQEQEQESIVSAATTEEQEPEERAGPSSNIEPEPSDPAAPARSLIVKAHSVQACVGLIILGLCVPLIGFLNPFSLPLLVAMAFLMILTGISWLRGRKKPPIACPYCGHFDNITLEATEFACPRCGKVSKRVGEYLETQ